MSGVVCAVVWLLLFVTRMYRMKSKNCELHKKKECTRHSQHCVARGGFLPPGGNLTKHRLAYWHVYNEKKAKWIFIHGHVCCVCMYFCIYMCVFCVFCVFVGWSENAKKDLIHTLFSLFHVFVGMLAYKHKTASWSCIKENRSFILYWFAASCGGDCCDGAPCS